MLCCIIGSLHGAAVRVSQSGTRLLTRRPGFDAAAISNSKLLIFRTGQPIHQSSIPICQCRPAIVTGGNKRAPRSRYNQAYTGIVLLAISTKLNAATLLQRMSVICTPSHLPWISTLALYHDPNGSIPGTLPGARLDSVSSPTC